MVVVLSFVFFIKLIEPVIEKQMTNIFADKKLSKKLSRELISSTEEFTPEKRLFYKNIIKKLYLKWVPLIEEAKREAELELKK